MTYLPRQTLEKEQTKPKASRREDSIKIRVEINERNNRNTEKISETKSFIKINKTDRLAKKQKK